MTAGWILILFAHVGPLAEGNSNALSTAWFSSEATCVAAGKKAKDLVSNTVKKMEFACVKQ